MRGKIAFIDEVGFSFLARVGTTWAPKGKPPVLRRVSKRRVLSTIVALTLDCRLFKRHFDHAVTGPDVIVALRHFRRLLPGPLIIVMDRLGAHTDHRVQEWIAADPQLWVEWLPAYAPDLNPEELCNRNIKGHLRNSTPDNEADMRRQVDREFARLRRRPDILRSFFEHVGLVDVSRNS
jgi:transposase